MIDVKNIYHSYTNDEKYSVEDISFNIEKGEVFGFLGPSGAGKSTTQNILIGLLELQQGSATIDGMDVKKANTELFNSIGVSFEQSNVYSKLTGLENLNFYKDLFSVDTYDSQELLEMVGLGGHANKRAGEYSKGMKHRLTFARSMINNPKIWFLDEPTTGLDPATAETIIDIIKEKQQKGTTIFLTTHNMHVADILCDKVAFIDNGKIVLIDSPRNLKLKYGQKLVEVEHVAHGQLIKESLSYVVNSDKAKLNNIINNGQLEMMHTKEATLEEIFIKVTGSRLV